MKLWYNERTGCEENILGAFPFRGCEREVRKLKKWNFIQWFVCLVRRDMKCFTQEMDDRQDVYEEITERIKKNNQKEKKI